MSRSKFVSVLKKEVARIDKAGTTKRKERVISGFVGTENLKAIIDGKRITIFNSNDYLGLRHNPHLKKAEHLASEKYGTGPGAVRFISGSLKIHRDLEAEVAKFHGRDDAMIFSSAFATNLAVLFSLIAGQNKDSLVSSDVLVVSDALNHRSIIDGIRLANLPKEQKTIFEHLNAADLDRILTENQGKYSRVLVVTDGVFSMLGQFQNLKAIKKVVDAHNSKYPEGTLLIVDDAHGVGAAGRTGRGTEEIEGIKADVLIGTFGKAFGSDGGYVVGDQAVIDYLRESSATYIYSNNITPGTAGAALAALKLVSSTKGKSMHKNLKTSIEYFKTKMSENGYNFAADSTHPIQPVLIGDPIKTKKLVDALFDSGFLVTNISYPVVAKGSDEIRVQISATHTKADLDGLIKAFKEAKVKLKL